jgi:zinc/manganese transport system permease protein
VGWLTVFSGFMVDTWTVATLVAVVAGLVGFFVVLRGSAFAAHAVPNGSFAGAAGASLVGVNTLFGLGAFSLLGALGIGWLRRAGRSDVVTALTLVLMLGVGSLFLSFSSAYAPEVYSLLFGEVLGISPAAVAPTAVLAALCVASIAILYRPLLLSSVLAEVGEARGVNSFRVELAFLVVLALTATMTVPVVGTLLVFSLMVGAPAAARSLARRPGLALALSVAIAIGIVWAAIALSYLTNFPVGFFVGTASALAYGTARSSAAYSARRAPRVRVDGA